ncbi:MAG: hypothetical protein ACK5M1_08215 [Xanthomarina gelatinilytica]|uniref:hypothetical protein n=1 Tax=Xanthomarina gelatinilytica TaxID=1137281 RepID=UPI003A888630
MENFKIDISRDKNMNLLLNGESIFVLTYKSLLSNNSTISNYKGEIFNLRFSNIVKTNITLVDENKITLFKTQINWNGNTSIKSFIDIKDYIFIQKTLSAKHLYSLIYDNDEVITMEALVTKNKIKSFKFMLKSNSIKNLELMLFLMANCSLFYLNLKKINL